MDPVLHGLLQQQQTPAAQQSMPMATPAPTPVANPFDVGIQAAIKSARESLQPTEAQRDRALRNSILSFGAEMGKLPRGRGFLENFANVGKAGIPAMLKYGEEEAAAEAQNNQIANQLLAYQAAQQNAQAAGQENEWKHRHEENKLGEQRRYHNLLNSFRPTSEERGAKQDLGERRLEEARLKREAVTTLGEKKLGLSSIPQRTRTFSVNLDAALKEMDYLERRLQGMDWSDTLQSYIPKTPTRAEMQTLSKMYKHTLARMEPFVAQGVLNTLPTIDPTGFPEANMKVIQAGREILGEQAKAIQKERGFLKGLIKEEGEERGNTGYTQEEEPRLIKMYNAEGAYREIWSDDDESIQEALDDGLVPGND